MTKPERKSGPHNQDTCPLAIAWMFKLMIDCSVHRGFINHCCFSDDDVARELGVYWLLEDHDDTDADADADAVDEDEDEDARLLALMEN